MATKYYGGFSGALGGVTLTDNSAAVLRNMENGIEAALIKIGIAAKRNIQQVIVDKDVYDTGELHRTIAWGSDGVIDKTPTEAVDVGSPKEYAVFNELGTVKMRARPFITPGVMDNMDEYKGIVADTLAEKMK